MESMFVVPDDLDFSDDDLQIDFSRGKSQFNCTSEKHNSSSMGSSVKEDIPGTVLVSQKQDYRTLSQYKGFTKSSDNLFACENQEVQKTTSFHGPTGTKNQRCNILDHFENDDTDELMSQIDMPNDSVGRQIECQQKPSLNLMKQFSIFEEKTNECYQSDQQFERDTHSSGQKSNDNMKSPCNSFTVDKTMSSCSKTGNHGAFTPGYQSTRLLNDKTPVKTSTCLPGSTLRDVTPFQVSRYQTVSRGITVQCNDNMKSPCNSFTVDKTTSSCCKTGNNGTFTPGYQSTRLHNDKTPVKTSTCLPGSTLRDVTPIQISKCQTVSRDITVQSNKRKACVPHVKGTPKQRRFPGPAGLLPSIDNYASLENLKSPEMGKGKRTLTPIALKAPIECMVSSSQDDDFKQSIWNDVQKQVYRLFPNRTCEAISKILQEATQNQLNNRKVALFCGLIKSFSISASGGKLVLKDPTGEINGTIHKNVLDEYEPDLCPGSGLILKDISVFSPSLRKHYINITPSNIVQIFPIEITEVSTQSQLTQMPRDNKDKENVVLSNVLERRTELEDNRTSDDSYTRLNYKSSDIFGIDDSDDNFFSDELLG